MCQRSGGPKIGDADPYVRTYWGVLPVNCTLQDIDAFYSVSVAGEVAFRVLAPVVPPTRAVEC